MCDARVATSSLLLSAALAACIPLRLSYYTTNDAKVHKDSCNVPINEVMRATPEGVEVTLWFDPSSGIGLREFVIRLRAAHRVVMTGNRLRITSDDLRAPIDLEIKSLLGAKWPFDPQDPRASVRADPGEEFSVAGDYGMSFLEIPDVRPARISVELPSLIVDGVSRTFAPVDLDLNQYWTVVGVCADSVPRGE